jgi:lipid-binding SYLF domain-containing protein
MEHFRSRSHSALAVLAVALACTALAGCTTTKPQDQGSSRAQRAQIDSSVDATLSKLYSAAPQSRDLVQRANGVLVFPSVVSVSFGIGGEHGDGALREGGRTVGYYSINGASIGWQAGAQSKAIVVLFMTPESLAKFRSSSGWTAGVDATVAFANIGANGSIDTATIQKPVIGFALTNYGLAAGISLQGQKVTPINP